MSRTTKIQLAWKKHHRDQIGIPDPTPEWDYNAALRLGNDRKSAAKAKVTQRRIDRAKLKQNPEAITPRLNSR